MTVFFANSAGFVSTFQDPYVPAQINFRLEGWQGFAGFKAILTRATINAQGNFQLSHSLGGLLHIASFGDRLGQCQVSGLAFDSTCADLNNAVVDKKTGLLRYTRGIPLGIEHVIEYYNNNRISARKTPLRMTIGTRTSAIMYLMSLTGDAVNPGSRLWQFSMQFAAVPDDPDSTEEESTSGLSTDGGTTIEMSSDAPADSGGTTIEMSGGTMPMDPIDEEFEPAWPNIDDTWPGLTLDPGGFIQNAVGREYLGGGYVSRQAGPNLNLHMEPQS